MEYLSKVRRPAALKIMATTAALIGVAGLYFLFRPSDKCAVSADGDYSQLIAMTSTENYRFIGYLVVYGLLPQALFGDLALKLLNHGIAVNEHHQHYGGAKWDFLKQWSDETPVGAIKADGCDVSFNFFDQSRSVVASDVIDKRWLKPLTEAIAATNQDTGEIYPTDHSWLQSDATLGVVSVLLTIAVSLFACGTYCYLQQKNSFAQLTATYDPESKQRQITKHKRDAALFAAVAALGLVIGGICIWQLTVDPVKQSIPWSDYTYLKVAPVGYPNPVAGLVVNGDSKRFREHMGMFLPQQQPSYEINGIVQMDQLDQAPSMGTTATADSIWQRSLFVGQELPQGGSDHFLEMRLFQDDHPDDVKSFLHQIILPAFLAYNQGIRVFHGEEQASNSRNKWLCLGLGLAVVMTLGGVAMGVKRWRSMTALRNTPTEHGRIQVTIDRAANLRAVPM